MKPHDYVPAHAGQCACGKSWYHEEHFGGDRKAAADAYHEDRAAAEKVDELYIQMSLGTRVRVRGTHPQFPGRRGIVTHLEPGTAVVQVDGRPLPIGIPLYYLDIESLVVPTFTSQEEADRWLEEHNPVPEPAPRFRSREEADTFLNRALEDRCGSCRHRRNDHWQNAHACQSCDSDFGPRCTGFVEWDGSCKECGDPDDHNGRACSSVPKGYNPKFDFSVIRRNSNLGVALRPGDTFTFTTRTTEW